VMTRVLAAAGIAAAAGQSVAGVESGPLYQPGMVRDALNLRSPLAPPQQPPDANFWAVEADISVIEGAEHFPFHTHPAQFAAAVGGFLARAM
jgi:pimeloyl-ACP methyl ester carboxylesterase